MAFWIKKNKKNYSYTYIHTYIQTKLITNDFIFTKFPNRPEQVLKYTELREIERWCVFFLLHFTSFFLFFLGHFIKKKKTEKKNNNNDRLKKRKQNFLWIGFPILKVSVLWLWPIEFYLATSSIKNLTTLSNT